MGKSFKILLMLSYKKRGRILYLLIFLISLIGTVLNKKHELFIFILLDVVIAISGLLFEVVLLSFCQKGTVYIETDRSSLKRELKNMGSPTNPYYIYDNGHEYVFQIFDEAYSRNYAKDAITVKQSSKLDIPLAEIINIIKTSQAADNEYSDFAISGDIIKSEYIKLFVKDISNDISSSN